MKAAVLFEKNDIRYTDWSEPQVEPGFVKINVKACGICGSDVPRVLGDAAHSFPIILGHEFSGVVTEVGDGVTGINIGTHCTVVPLRPCMNCPDCEDGNYSLCKNYLFIGSRINGGMAEYVTVPASNVLKIDDSISFIQGATIEPSTVALHAVKLAKLVPGKKVAVIGCGIIGCFLLEWAKLYGASDVVAIGRSDSGLKAARALNIGPVLNSSDDCFDNDINEITNGRGFDCVFESAGSVSAMISALKIAGNKGTVCYVGTPKTPVEMTIKEWEYINRKELTVTGSWMSYSSPFPGSEWTETIDRYLDHKLKLIPEMISQTYPLSDVVDAFNNYKTPGKVKGRIILTNE